MIILVPVNYQNPHLISLDAAPSTPPALLLNPAKVCKRCSKTRNICPAVNFSCVFCDPERVSSELVFKFFSSKRSCHFFISPVTPVLECWRKVRVALGPGLIIRVTIKDPWLVFSGRFHRGPSRTREWVLSGGLHKRIITCTLYILSSHRKTCSSRKQSGVFCRIFLFWHLILFVGEHFRHLE